jgi:hypothetical protein
MGFDIQMIEQPKPAELKKIGLAEDSHGFYRVKAAMMPVMVLTMEWAGALAEDDTAPDFPAWPPKDAPADRKKVLDAAGSDPKAEAQLTPAEKKQLAAAKKATHDAQTVHSKHAGMVPAFKFATNDGFIVTADEAKVISTKLHAYADKVNAAQLAKLQKAYEEKQKPLAEAAKKRGETVPPGAEQLNLTVDNFKAWVNEWAGYNDVASHHGGYKID